MCHMFKSLNTDTHTDTDMKFSTHPIACYKLKQLLKLAVSDLCRTDEWGCDDGREDVPSPSSSDSEECGLYDGPLQLPSFKKRQ